MGAYRLEGLDLPFLRCLRRPRFSLGHRLESDRVPLLELSGFPQVRLDDGGRADEAAEAGAVGAEDDGQVAGEVDGADGVGVVVDVGRVQPRLAAVGTGPGRVRAAQADAGAVGVVVDLPAGRED